MVIVVAVPNIIGYYINRHKMKWVWKNTNEWTPDERKLRYTINNMTEFNRAKDIRVFGMQGWLSEFFDRVFKHRCDWYRKQDKWENKWETLETFVNQLIGDFIAYAYIIYLVVNGNVGVGDFVLYSTSQKDTQSYYLLKPHILGGFFVFRYIKISLVFKRFF